MFILFTGDSYYPCGGWNDYRGVYVSLEQAKESFEKEHSKCDWAHIVDISTHEIVWYIFK